MEYIIKKEKHTNKQNKLFLCTHMPGLHTCGGQRWWWELVFSFTEGPGVGLAAWHDVALIAELSHQPFLFLCFFLSFFKIFIRYFPQLHFQCYPKSPPYLPPYPYPPTPTFWPWRSPVLGHIKFASPMGPSFQWWPTRPSFDTYASGVKSSGTG